MLGIMAKIFNSDTDVDKINDKIDPKLSKLEDKVNALDRDVFMLKTAVDRILEKLTAIENQKIIIKESFTAMGVRIPQQLQE